MPRTLQRAQLHIRPKGHFSQKQIHTFKRFEVLTPQDVIETPSQANTSPEEIEAIRNEELNLTLSRGANSTAQLCLPVVFLFRKLFYYVVTKHWTLPKFAKPRPGHKCDRAAAKAFDALVQELTFPEVHSPDLNE
jgi:hypothetical protein